MFAVLSPSLFFRATEKWQEDPGQQVCTVPKYFDAGLCILSESDGLGPESATPSYRCMPSFVLLSTPNSGAMELAWALKRHPRMQSNEEQPFSDFPNQTSWRKYLESFDSIPARQVAKVVTFGSRARPTSEPGVANTDYYRMGVDQIEQFFKLAPSLKLVVSLRDPIDRLYTWFRQQCHSGNILTTDDKKSFGCRTDVNAESREVHGETIRNTKASCSPATFEKLVLTALLAPSTASGSGCIPEAIAAGKYDTWVQNWLRVFPAGNVHAHFPEVDKVSAAQSLRSVESFVRVAHYPYDKLFADEGYALDRGIAGGNDLMTKPTAAALDAFYKGHCARVARMLDISIDSCRDLGRGPSQSR
jgi:hypothetical protein